MSNAEKLTKMNESINKLFQSVGNTIDNFFASSGIGNEVNSNILGYISGFFDVVAAFITAWIIYRGYKIAFGKDNDNFTNFLWDSVKKGFVVILCFYYTEYINLVNGMVSEIREFFLQGNTHLWSSISSLVQNGSLTATVTLSESSFLSIFSGHNTLTALIASIVIMITLLIGILPIVTAYAINTLTFFLLIAIFPICVFLFIFDWFKQVFVQWLQLMLNCLLNLILINTIVKGVIIFAEQNTHFYEKQYASTSIILICLSFLFFSLLIKIFTELCTGVAQNLTQVSMESFAGSAIAKSMGVAGSVAGGAAAGAFAGAKVLTTAAPQTAGARFFGGIAKHAASDIGGAVANKTGLSAAKKSIAESKLGVLASKLNQYSKGK